MKDKTLTHACASSNLASPTKRIIVFTLSSKLILEVVKYDNFFMQNSLHLLIINKNKNALNRFFFFYKEKWSVIDSEEEIGVYFGEDILRLYGNIDISKAKEYQDVVEQYYHIEIIIYGIKNNRTDFIEKGRKEIYIRTHKEKN